MAKQQLSNWTIVSLRPQGQHASVRHVAALWQAKCCTFSIYKLIATPNNQTLSNALSAQIRIISSPSAVHFASQKARLSGHWLAVGQQTAKLLYEAGASSVSVAKPQSAEGLLNLDELQMVQAISIGIITAPKGRGLLEETLQQRGAKLQMAYVYRRQVLKLNAKQLALIDQMSAKTAILVSSQSAFEQFWQQLNEPRKAIIKSLICIASSTRLLEYLQSLGLSHVLCSDSTLAQDQMSTLAETVLPTE
jgi:uroporphyrinogen-III synthase